MRRAAVWGAIVLFAIAAFFLIGGVATLVALAAGAEADADLGPSGTALVGAVYAAVGLVFGWLGWTVWSGNARSQGLSLGPGRGLTRKAGVRPFGVRPALQPERVERLGTGGDQHALRLQVEVERLETELATEA
jgi:hypothetical protein